jgi:putative ABC transport system permease protein
MLRFVLRNIQRNRKRSFLTILAIFFAAMVVGVAHGWVQGVMNMYLDSYISNQTGHVRVTTEEFLKRERFMPVDAFIRDSDRLADRVEDLEGVEDVEQRVRFGILLSKDENTAEAVGMGIDLEKNRFNLSENITQGAFTGTGLYIGEILARRLGVSEGEEILVATRTSEGGLNGIKLRVEGIFRLGNGFYDRKFFFLSLSDARRLLKMEDAITEILVFAEDQDETSVIEKQVTNIAGNNLAVQDYRTQLGDFYVMLETARVVYLIIEGLILFLGSFVIINTMMMNIFERIREIGTLKALGMSDRQVFWNYTAEGAVMGAMGGVAGALVGFIFIVFLSFYGVNLESFMQGIDMPLDYVIKPRVNAWQLVVAVLLSVIIPALSAMIPARYVNRLMPAEALRK